MKNVGINKRRIAICLFFLMCINSFGAVVSDNDGSAFITKAEFDSLKNNFQSQIDSYNQSIDSKIDGAIASYLAGIRLAKSGMTNTLLDMSGGILSVVDDSVTPGTASSYKAGVLPWTYAAIGLNFNGQFTKVASKSELKGTTPQFSTQMIGLKRNPGDLKLRLTKSWDSVNKEALWMGYCKVHDNISGTSFKIIEQKTADHPRCGFESRNWVQPITGTGSEDDPYMVYLYYDFYPHHQNETGADRKGGVNSYKDDRIPLTEKDVDLINIDIEDASGGGSWNEHTLYINTYYVNSKFYYRLSSKGLSFERTVLDTQNKYIIVCDNSREHYVHRISDNDIISGFCSENGDEAFKSGLSLVTSHSWGNYFGSGVTITGVLLPYGFQNVMGAPVLVQDGSKFKAKFKDTDTDDSVFQWKLKWSTGYTRSATVGDWWHTQRPYFGFLDDIDDWKMLANDFEGTLPIGDIITSQPSGEVAYTNANNKTLMIGAGIPLLKAEKNLEYKFNMKVTSSSATGETGNYHIWFKNGTFTKGTAPDDENNLLSVEGVSTVSGMKCYEMIPGQNYAFTFKPDKDGYIFCKWQNAALGGGGILSVEREVETFNEG